MRYSLALVALAAAAVNAQGTAPAAASPVAVKGKCKKTSDTKSFPDPLKQFAPGAAQWPCDMGAAIPFGPVPKGCAKLEVIVARGTSEGGDLGVVVGDPLVARVARDLPGVTVRGYPVQYPASAMGMATGIADIPKRLKAQAQECPDEKFVLAGYSQGGSVVMGALSSVPADLRDKVIAVALYGPMGGVSGLSSTFKNKTITNCAVGDIICLDLRSGPGHTSYNDEGTKWHDRTASYIAAAYNGKPMGWKSMGSPTAAL
ncbi:alpha/beta-hydrolase [Microthyrium microscopicum]|uniref:Alpha/beta-hydrolase n=1 Tax=Microthyrium microscopicum TaxID=703497 RepID=A0A6A6UFB5_9PEZI|nr:alpha/beta-hydrolase [Microthyrium microscopicum]